MDGQPWVLETAGAPTTESGMNPFQGFLHLLADPNIAFILFTLGFLGLLFELHSPNLVTGILGAFAIILAFIGFGSLPLNVGGLLLIVLAIVLFVLEVTVTSHGLLAIGGLIAFVLGRRRCTPSPGRPPARYVAVALPIIVVMTARSPRRSSRWSCWPRLAPVGCRRPTSACTARWCPGSSLAWPPRSDMPSCPPGPSMLPERNGPPGARTAATWSAARRCASWVRTA